MTSSSSPNVPPILDVADVDQLRGAGRSVVLADVRWYLDGRDGRAAFESEHLPDAVFVDLENDLSRHDLAPGDGRHPLPTPESFAASMSRLGIGDDTVVVAYDDTGGMTAGRLVVMLRLIGHDAALLDGGLMAAGVSGLGTVSGPAPEPAPATFTTRPWPADRLAAANEVARRPLDDDGISIDARAVGRFTGEVAMIDPRPGHIPGARSAPWDAVLDPSTGRFLTPEQLRSHFAERGITHDTGDVIAYCGSGVSTCMNVLALEHAGLPPARLYVASFSGWSADPDRPVEIGEGNGTNR